MNWLTRLVSGLINEYVPYEEADIWGNLESPCRCWREFIDIGVEEARESIGDVLPAEDYDYVKAIVEEISKIRNETRFVLHGDSGVHNFVFREFELVGVIDPSPVVGPILYDFIYAFCSSPDDLSLETLMAGFTLLRHEPMKESTLIREVLVQLYGRIGICRKHHPHDLQEYLIAWQYWKRLVR